MLGGSNYKDVLDIRGFQIQGCFGYKAVPIAGTFGYKAVPDTKPF